MTDPKPQLTRDDLSTMTPEEIVEAKTAGQLDDVLGRPRPDVEGMTNSVDIIAGLVSSNAQDELIRRTEAGEFSHYLRTR